MKRFFAVILSFILFVALFPACTANTDIPGPTSNAGSQAEPIVTAEPTPFPDELEAAEPIVTAEPTPLPDVSEAKETIFTRDISNESKEKALEQLYKTAKVYFASWNTFTLDDWNAAYPSALERVLATDNIYDFYMELKRFVVMLNDHHSEVSFPESFYNDICFTPIRFEYIENGYYITGGKSDELEKLPQFSKIVKIDGIPVDTYMEQNVFPYIWHAKLNTAVNMDGGGAFFARCGPGNTSQSFEAVTPEGKTVTATVDRIPVNKPVENWIDLTSNIDAVFEDVFTSDLLTIKYIDGDYIYVYIPHFWYDGVASQFEAHLDKLKEAKGIIIDVRGNRGGNSIYAASIAGHFIDGAYPDLYAEKSVYDINKDGSTLRSIPFSEYQGSGDITAPVIVLQDYLTFSAGEHFLDFMSSAQKAKSIGTESAGATGDPKWVTLPEDGSARFSYYKIYRHDKTPFLNIGIQPDIFVDNSIEDYMNGYDRILGTGLTELKEICDGD